MSAFANAKELSAQIGINRYKLLRLAKVGAIPCLRLSRRNVKFDLDSVRAALLKMQTPVKTPKPKPVAK